MNTAMVGYFPFLRRGSGSRRGYHRSPRDASAVSGTFKACIVISASQVLARKGNNTLDVIFGEDRVEYRYAVKPGG